MVMERAVVVRGNAVMFGAQAVVLGGHPWRQTEKSVYTLTTRNSTRLDKLSKAYSGIGEGGWLCVGGDGDSGDRKS